MELPFPNDLAIEAQTKFNGSVTDSDGVEYGENGEEEQRFTTRSKEKWKEGTILSQSGVSNTPVDPSPPAFTISSSRPKAETPESPARASERGRRAVNQVTTPKRRARNKFPPIPGNPRWSVVRQPPTNITTSSTALSDTVALRPRQWCSTKAELLTILPELSGSRCVNGISWEHSPVPVILIEEDNGIIFSEPQDTGSETEIDISMVREFVCTPQDLSRPCNVSGEEEHISLLIDDSMTSSPALSIPSSSKCTEASESVGFTANSKKRGHRDGRPKVPPNQFSTDTVKRNSLEYSTTPKKKWECQNFEATTSHNSPSKHEATVSVVSSASTTSSISTKAVADIIQITDGSSFTPERNGALPALEPPIPSSGGAPPTYGGDRSHCTSPSLISEVGRNYSGPSSDTQVHVSDENQTGRSEQSGLTGAPQSLPSQPQKKPFSLAQLKFKKTVKASEIGKAKESPILYPTHSPKTISQLVQKQIGEPEPGENRGVHGGTTLAIPAPGPATLVKCAAGTDQAETLNESKPVMISPLADSHLSDEKRDFLHHRSSVHRSAIVEMEIAVKPLHTVSPATSETQPELTLQSQAWREGSEPGEICMVGDGYANTSGLNPNSAQIDTSTAKTTKTMYTTPDRDPPSTSQAQTDAYFSECRPSRPLLYHQYSIPAVSTLVPVTTGWDRNQRNFSQDSAASEQAENSPPLKTPSEVSRCSVKHSSHSQANARNQTIHCPPMLPNTETYSYRTSSPVSLSSVKMETTSLLSSLRANTEIESSQSSDSPPYLLFFDGSETQTSSPLSSCSMCTTSTPPTSPPSEPLRKAPDSFALRPIAEQDSTQYRITSLRFQDRAGEVSSVGEIDYCQDNEGLPVPSMPSLGTYVHDSKQLVFKSLELLQEAATSRYKSESKTNIEQQDNVGSIYALSRKRKPDLEEQTPLKKQATMHEIDKDGKSFDSYLPAQNPAEIQILTESYVHGTPVLCIASRTSFSKFLRKTKGEVREECKYMYLGFFQVTQVKETRISRPRVTSKKPQIAPGLVTGKASWRFKLQWNAGGEEELQLPSHLQLDRPWWRDLSDWNVTETGGTKQKENPSSLNTTLHPSRAKSPHAMDTSSEPASCSSASASFLPPTSKVQADTDGVDSDTETTPFYRECRRADINYPLRHEPLGLQLPSLVWLSLLVANSVEDDSRSGGSNGAHQATAKAISASGAGDGGSWKGWYCTACGKLNRQTFFRRRQCSSSFCKDIPITACAVQELDTLREVGQHLPMVLPLNTVPSYVDPLIVDWDDGMRTLVYRQYQNNLMRPIEKVGRNMQLTLTGELSSDQEIGVIQGRRDVVVKHIFTCNHPALQEEQTDLLKRIQEDVVLAREATDLRPYFSYTVGVPSMKGSSSAACFASSFASTSFPPIAWSEAPSSIQQAKGLLEHLGRHYGEPEEAQNAFSINQLVVLAWTVLGRKKGEAVLFAKDNSMMVMCLGHEVTIELTPQSRFRRAPAHSSTDLIPSRPPILKPKSVTVGASEATETMIAPSSNNTMVVDIATEAGTLSEDSKPPNTFQASDKFTPPMDEIISDIGTNSSHLPSNALPQATAATESTTTADKVLTRVPSQSGPEHRPEGFMTDSDFTMDALLQMPPAKLSDDVEIKEEKETDQRRMSWIDLHVKAEDEDVDIDVVSAAKWKCGASREPLKEKMRFTLVHGDALLLSGDEFEYTIQRTGVSLLLVGSNVPQIVCTE